MAGDSDGDGDGDGDEFCDDPFDDDEDDDGESEEFYDDSEGKGDPCDDGEDDEESCDDGDEDEASCDDGDEDEDEDEESCDDGDDGECEDLCDELSGDDDESEGEELCGIPCDGGGSVRDGSESDLSDSLEDRSSSEEEEEEEEEVPGLGRGGERRLVPSGFDRGPPPVTGAFRMVVGFDDTDSDSYDYSDGDSTYSDVGDVEFPSLPASRAAVAGLPEATLSEEEASCGCPICKDVLASGQRVVWLPCKHYFHGDCIRPWLAIRSTCPVCRYQLPTDDAESGQRQARELTVLVPVAHQGALPQTGGGGRGEGNSCGATIGAGDATGCSTDDVPEQGASWRGGGR